MGKSTYTLRQVVDLTGLSEFTLRGWENRYQAFRPSRSETGRRRYSSTDLQRAMLMRELVQAAHRIRDIAGLRLDELQALAAAKAIAPAVTVPDHVREVFEMVHLHDWDEVEKRIHSFCRLHTVPSSIRFLMAPLLSELGSRVEAGVVSVTQEHMLSAFVKHQLYQMSPSVMGKVRSPRLLIATPEGDPHELGILIAKTLCSARGIRHLYLGPHTPKEQLAEAAIRFGVSHVVLGSTLSKAEGARDDLYTYVHYLDSHLPRRIEFWLGGRGVKSFHAKLIRKLHVFNNIEEFDERILTFSTRHS